ncbi:uncharacterized protein LOC126631899 isoform X2 [Malus sylvestris]|uniref:uncharacterized protein LOC126631899 isoform X2 n=1 Tax=Malus sylvestris TaxID=3752 RepID=UPI0021AC2F62|nr:uncharacterized protein LOC126631899 isoform X2 [Malus sylvestris]
MKNTLMIVLEGFGFRSSCTRDASTCGRKIYKSGIGRDLPLASTTEGTVLRRLQRRRLSEIVALLCIRKEMKIKIHLSSALRAVSICAFIELTGARSFLVACQSKESSSSKALQNSKNPGLKIDIGHKLVTALLYPVQKSHVFAGTVMVPETLINIA